MSNDKYKVGMSVVSPKSPQWGMGKIIVVYERTIIVRFHNGGTRELNASVTPLDIVGDGEVATSRVRAASDKELIEAHVDFFAKPPQIFSLTQLERSKPPPRGGVYGWYFKKRPPYVPSKDCPPRSGKYKRWKLLYIGLGSNLRSRILTMHFHGDASCSALRRSLGCLLARKLNLYLWKIPTSEEGNYRYTFGDKGEVELSKWMAKYARVAYVENTRYQELEKVAIARYCPPLNTQDNPRPFTPLQVLKSAIKECASLRGSKPQRKAARKAYDEFIQNCRMG